MKLIYKLLSGYLILVLLAFLTYTVSVRSYRNIEKNYNQVTEIAVPQMQALEKIKAASLGILGSTSEYVLLATEQSSAREHPATEAPKKASEGKDDNEAETTASQQAGEEEEITAGATALKESLSYYEKLLNPQFDTTGERQILPQIKAASDRLIEDSARIIALKKRGVAGQEIIHAKERLEASEQAVLKAIEEAMEEEYRALKNAENNVHAVIASATRTTTLIDLCGLLLALAVGLFVSRSISNRVQKLKDATQAVSDGNLDEQLTVHAKDEIGDLARSFNTMTAALKTSRQAVIAARNFTESIIESMSDLVVVVNATGTVQRANSAAAEILGFDKDQAIGQPLDQICSDHAFMSDPRLTEAEAALTALNFERYCPTSDGRKIPMSVSVVPLRDPLGQARGMVCVGRDITESKEAAEKIQAALVEKDVLLKEIHHRVKNNLQIISSLLNMQARKITDEKSRAIFLDSQNRVKSMALIHESLYQSTDLSQIDFDDYLRKLASHILRSYNLEADRIQLTFSGANLSMSVDAAVPCGLIINELISNSLKYAFPEQRKGEIRIALRLTPQGYSLTCADNGVGLPPDFDITQTTSLGLKIVRTLTDQLNGELRIHTTNGTTFEILFP